MAGARGNAATTRAAQGQDDRAQMLERLKAKRPMRAEFPVPLSDEPIRVLRDARDELARREELLAGASNEVLLDYAHKRTEEAREAVAKAEAAAAADCVTLVFEGLPRDDFRALLDAHQPTKDKDKADGLNYDPVTFPPALIAATCVDPGFDSPEEVVELVAEWNVTERETLFTTAMSTCILSRSASWGKGSAATRS